jgi:FkbM family methyltransferase
MAKPLKLISRILELMTRFTASCQQVGAAASLRIFSYLIRRKTKIARIRTPGKSDFFYFDPALDKGVLSHFYKTGYRILGDVSVIVDAGANIGDETCRFRHFHPHARIIAIEPANRNFALLAQSFANDPLTILVNGALWHKKSVLTLCSTSSQEGYYLDGAGTTHTNTDPTIQAPFQVEAFTLPDLAKKLKFDRISILKIDIEGAEREVFCEGDNEWLRKVDCIIMEMPDNDAPGSFQKICDSLAHLAMNYYICGENIVCIKSGSGLTLKTVTGFDR